MDCYLANLSYKNMKMKYLEKFFHLKNQGVAKKVRVSFHLDKTAIYIFNHYHYEPLNLQF